MNIERKCHGAEVRGREEIGGADLNEFIITKHSYQHTPQEITRMTFGIDIAELIRRIVENRDGQFDALYAPAENQVQSFKL